MNTECDHDDATKKKKGGTNCKRRRRKRRRKKNKTKTKNKNKNLEDDSTVTLGVSIVLYNHRPLHPDPVRSSSHLHRSTNKGDASTSSRCPDQTSSELDTNFRQHRWRAISCQAIYSPAMQLCQQPSDTEDYHVHQCRLFRVLVAVYFRGFRPVFRRVVQPAVRGPICRHVARKRQQRSQRVHLFRHQQTVQTRVCSTCVTALLFQTVQLLLH